MLCRHCNRRPQSEALNHGGRQGLCNQCFSDRAIRKDYRILQSGWHDCVHCRHQYRMSPGHAHHLCAACNYDEAVRAQYPLEVPAAVRDGDWPPAWMVDELREFRQRNS